MIFAKLSVVRILQLPIFIKPLLPGIFSEGTISAFLTDVLKKGIHSYSILEHGSTTFLHAKFLHLHMKLLITALSTAIDTSIISN